MPNDRTRQWVYHHKYQAKIVLKSDAAQLYKEDWYPSPALLVLEPEPEKPEPKKPKKKKK